MSVTFSSYTTQINGRNALVTEIVEDGALLGNELPITGVYPIGEVSLFSCELTTPDGATTLSPELGTAVAFAPDTIARFAYADAPLPFFEVSCTARYALPPPGTDRTLYVRPNPDVVGAATKITIRVTVLEGHG